MGLKYGDDVLVALNDVPDISIRDIPAAEEAEVQQNVIYKEIQREDGPAPVWIINGVNEDIISVAEELVYEEINTEIP